MKVLLIALGCFSACIASFASYAEENYSVGDTVYIYEESTDPHFWGMSRNYYYARGSVEGINGSKIRISIRDVCSNNTIRGGVHCEDTRYDAEYKSGRYYWVGKYSLNRYPSEW